MWWKCHSYHENENSKNPVFRFISQVFFFSLSYKLLSQQRRSAAIDNLLTKLVMLQEKDIIIVV